MKTECATMDDVLLHIQDRCNFSVEDAAKFLPVLQSLGYFEAVTQTGTYSFLIEIPETWAEIYCQHVDIWEPVEAQGEAPEGNGWCKLRYWE
jgi:hypothetical protein